MATKQPPIPPPSLSALTDALAIVRLALNPEQALDLIERLHDETKSHTETLQAIMAHKADVETREKDLDAREASVKAKEIGIADLQQTTNTRERETAQKERSLQAQLAAHAQRVADHEEQERVLADQQERHAAAQRSFDQVSAARTTELDNREAQLKEAEAAHEARLARLRELAA
jgi:GH25 family lysozyme M1 (1,4-beta-N-acetylmuramidase)